jgi:hypothetical protein
LFLIIIFWNSYNYNTYLPVTYVVELET